MNLIVCVLLVALMGCEKEAPREIVAQEPQTLIDTIGTAETPPDTLNVRMLLHYIKLGGYEYIRIPPTWTVVDSLRFAGSVIKDYVRFGLLDETFPNVSQAGPRGFTIDFGDAMLTMDYPFGDDPTCTISYDGIDYNAYGDYNEERTRSLCRYVFFKISCLVAESGAEQIAWGSALDSLILEAQRDCE